MQHVAFLRGMNLGGRRITNDDLCAAFEALGYGTPWAFLASGNVVFESAARSQAKLARDVANGLERELGYAVPTFLRNADEVRALGAAEPFEVERGARGGKLQIALLEKPPDAKSRRAVLALSTDADQLHVAGRELYWLPAGGLSESDLDFKAVERALGMLTVRTQGTFARLARKL